MTSFQRTTLRGPPAKSVVFCRLRLRVVRPKGAPGRLFFRQIEVNA
jgi:hypothetical protein